MLEKTNGKLSLNFVKTELTMLYAVIVLQTDTRYGVLGCAEEAGAGDLFRCT